MSIPSGSTDRKKSFVAVDPVDLVTRKTGLTGFTVYRSRDGATPVVYTTPTITELSAANTPGVYALLIDEDTTLAAGHDTEEYVFHVTHGSMAPVTRAFDIFRPKITEGQTVTAANGNVDADVERWLGSVAPAAPATQASVNTIDDFLDTEMASALISLSAILAAVDTEVTGIKNKTDLIPAAPAAVGDVPTAAQVTAAVFARLIYTGLTFENAMKICTGGAGGLISGAGSPTETIRNPFRNTQDLMVATMDSSGNRSAIIFNFAD